jgi:hypothetical protein
MNRKLLWLCCLLLGQATMQSMAQNADTLIDQTAKVKNATCTGNNGWSRNASDAAADYATNNPEFVSQVYGGVGIESWYRSPLQNTALIWQDVAGLLPGHYKLTAYVCGQVYNDNANKGKNMGPLYLFAGDGQTLITSNVWEEKSVECDVEAGATLKIGIWAGDGNKDDWTGIAQVKLVCTALGKGETLALNEHYDMCAAYADTYADVILSKHFQMTGWTPLCLPFDLDEATTAQYFSQVAELTGCTLSGTTVVPTLSDVKSIQAGKPYMVKEKTAQGDLLKFYNRQVSAAAPTAVSLSGGFKAVGSYRKLAGVADAYIYHADSGTFVKAPERNKVLGFSFYLLAQ